MTGPSGPADLWEGPGGPSLLPVLDRGRVSLHHRGRSLRGHRCRTELRNRRLQEAEERRGLGRDDGGNRGEVEPELSRTTCVVRQLRVDIHARRGTRGTGRTTDDVQLRLVAALPVLVEGTHAEVPLGVFLREQHAGLTVQVRHGTGPRFGGTAVAALLVAVRVEDHLGPLVAPVLRGLGHQLDLGVNGAGERDERSENSIGHGRNLRELGSP